jgi:hypothetical protein
MVTITLFFKNVLNGCIFHALEKFSKCHLEGIHLGGKRYNSSGDFTEVVIIHMNGAKNNKDKNINKT